MVRRGKILATLAGLASVATALVAHAAGASAEVITPNVARAQELYPSPLAREYPAKHWRFTVLYTFQKGGYDGNFPGAGLLADKSGALYGTTSEGVQFTGRGTAFKLTPSGSGYAESVIHSFGNGTDGIAPESPLIADKNGTLYGMTPSGGNNNRGTVLSLTPKGSQYEERVVYNFPSEDNTPQGSLIADKSSALYGTMSAPTCCRNEYGNVYKLTPSGSAYTESLLYNFQGGNDGINPLAGLLADKSGALYGTTWLGGGQCGCGTVFKLIRSGSQYTESVLWRFHGSDGAGPSASLIADSGGPA